MPILTQAQKTALKNDINGRANLASAVAAQDWPLISNFYNTTASPTVNVWNPFMTVAQINSAINWTNFVAQTVQQLLAFDQMTKTGVVDASNANVRGGFSKVLDSASATSVQAAAQKQATYFEGLYAVSDPPANDTPFYGQLMDASTVQDAMLHG